jgi:hypothetical protein
MTVVVDNFAALVADMTAVPVVADNFVDYNFAVDYNSSVVYYHNTVAGCYNLLAGYYNFAADCNSSVGLCTRSDCSFAHIPDYNSGFA